MAEQVKDVVAEEAVSTKKFSFKSALEYFKSHIDLFIPYLGLILCVLVFTIVPPLTTGRTIYTKAFFNSFVDRSITLMIISLGAMFIYSMGSMDISIGASAGVASIIMVSLSNSISNNGTQNQALAVIVGMIVAVLFTTACGAVNTSVGEFLHLPAVIGSIFLMFFGGGVVAIMFMTRENITFYGNFDFFKQTWFRIAFVVVFALVTFYLFKFTKVGKYTRAIGTNVTVAKQSGINIWLYRFIGYAYLGLAVVFASFNALVRTPTVNKSTGGNFHMQIMIALILGGMPLSGGMKSKISAAIIGTMIYNILDTGLILSGVPMNITPFIKAVILFTIIVLTCRRKATTLQR